MSKNLEKLLDKLKQQLNQTFDNNLILFTLYGSYARNEATKDSDVDLLVVLKNLSRETELMVEQIFYQAMWDTNFSYFLSLNLVSQAHYQLWKHNKATLLQNIQQDGYVIWPN